MTKTERRLLDKAALAAFGALMARDSALLPEHRAAKAWQAATAFVEARGERRIKRFLNRLGITPKG
jgi:predicted NAD/FAD-binding protein